MREKIGELRSRKRIKQKCEWTEWWVGRVFIDRSREQEGGTEGGGQVRRPRWHVQVVTCYNPPSIMQAWLHVFDISYGFYFFNIENSD